MKPNKHYLRDGPEGFEDGTINYLNLPAVEIGLRHLENVGMDLIHERVTVLTGWLLDQRGALRHSNGAPAVRIYGPNDGQRRGGTVICNFLTPEGALVDYRPIEALANARRISVGMVTNLADLHAFIRFAHDVTNDIAAGVLHAGPRN